MQTTGGIEKSIEFYSFPFLGSTTDAEPFQYLLYGIKEDSIEIAITDWLVSRVKLNVGNKVELHLPAYLREKFKLGNKNPTTVIARERSKEMQGDIYRISFVDKESEDIISTRIYDEDSSESSPIELLTYLIKDSLILKQGVRVYLKHLVPYFSRIVNYTPEEFRKLKEYFFNDIVAKVHENELKLKSIYDNIRTNLKKIDEIPIFVDLEEIRTAIESEISLTLFEIMFGNKKTIDDSELSIREEYYGFSMYINSIKFLEKRSCLSYNRIVVLYLNSVHTN